MPRVDFISSTECAVIAVNSCRLSDFAFEDLGISQLPFAVEAVFPVGPIAVPITPDGQPAGEAVRTPRHAIRKPNGSDISTANFLDPCYANVSAVIGGYQRETLDGTLRITVVHNPLAKARLSTAILGANKEYIADDQGDHYIVRLLTETPD